MKKQLLKNKKQNVTKEQKSKYHFEIYETTGLKGVGVHAGLHIKIENGKWYFLPITTTPQGHYKFIKHLDTGNDNQTSIFLGTKLKCTELKNRKRLTKKMIFPEDEDNVYSIIQKALKKAPKGK